jgi:predicted phosphodiesterase
MRYLVFGDVHGNVDALDTVLAAAGPLDVGGYLCVGDVVGYGPSEVECLERLIALQRAGKLAWVAGNHELAVRGDIDLEGYTVEAIKTLAWTESLLAAHESAKDFLLAAPATLFVDDAIWLTHDSLADPGSGHYHRQPQSAKSELACLRHQGGRVCFYGHTHMMRAEVLINSGVFLVPLEAHESAGKDPRPLRLPAGQLAWIGTGSVGLPTNQKRLAEFLVLDDAGGEEWVLEKYALQYPRDKAKERARAVLTGPCGEAVAERIVRWL